MQIAHADLLGSALLTYGLVLARRILPTCVGVHIRKRAISVVDGCCMAGRIAYAVVVPSFWDRWV